VGAEISRINYLYTRVHLIIYAIYLRILQGALMSCSAQEFPQRPPGAPRAGKDVRAQVFDVGFRRRRGGTRVLPCKTHAVFICGVAYRDTLVVDGACDGRARWRLTHVHTLAEG
jgi:hypothetical protein